MPGRSSRLASDRTRTAACRRGARFAIDARGDAHFTYAHVATMPDWRPAQVRHGGELLQWMVDHIVALQESARCSNASRFCVNRHATWTIG
ncbi:hypothetical protein QZM46_10085 [Burkholderia vietnamiensis]|uniref:Uncharacterized protein n=1 Tax=Burkholderia ubonensis TaxID=101571 RepID=A0A1B4LMS6_9BURK|nr:MULTISPECIES: hypothetical protein [Burkholderia]AOJ78448.1 hypothetical protein WJ35_26025 [Burkholderia ubonensis]AOK12251.1 hypothetical protein WK31_18300 [Burkholderia vietnamiensis]AOK43703.1 hypothetical protein WL96_21790 [Burkholderia vietnamiensis]KVE01139.1 hypothetical protein WI91_24220 [Burkholderia vietnamiensis]KVE15064.1 hypothetical protein WI92_10580 [Burkholderia vietnamiensis]